MDDDARYSGDKNRWVDVLLAMHAFNDVSAKHHDESSRRSANVFILIYFFLCGTIVTNGLNSVSLLVAILLTVFARVGKNLVRSHSAAAEMHYWRNRKIRDELDTIRGADNTSLGEIFADSRKQFLPHEYYKQHSWHVDWAIIHKLFMTTGIIITILTAINQLSCFGENGCFWIKAGEPTEKLTIIFKDVIKRIFPSL
ncbi:MAG: hypothetical protein ACLPX9_21575 [Rhodomicrobium sp.]